MQIGHAGKNKGSNDTENLGGPAGLFVYPKTNELFVADGYFNHRVIVFDADTGAYKRHWGAYGKKPDDELHFPARAQLLQGPPPPQFNNPVHAVLVSNDDLVYVADRTNNRLQVFRLDGTFVKEVFIARNTLQAEGTVHHFALSPGQGAAVPLRRRWLQQGRSRPQSTDAGDRGERRRARRTQRARVLPRPQRRCRLEGQPLPRRGQQRAALLPVRVQGHADRVHGDGSTELTENTEVTESAGRRPLDRPARDSR